MRQTLTKLGAALLALTLLTAGAAAAISTVNFGADAAQNPELTTDLTKDYHEVGWSAVEYEDDSGEMAELAAELNDTAENPVSFVATDIEAEEFGEFPRLDEEDGENTASALDASEWTVDDGSTAGTATVSDVTTAANVDAVEIDTDSQTSGDSAVFTYSNVSITSDVDKRYVQLAADVNTLDSGVDATLRLVDGDGDYATATLANASATADDEVVLANSTGEGAVMQTQIGTLPVDGTGDGVLDGIQSVEVHVDDADASLRFSLMNAEKMGEYQFGEERYDSDDDGELDDTRQITDHAGGAMEITEIATMGSTFDEAAIHGVTYPMLFDAESAAVEDVNVSFDSADAYPSYDHVVDQYYRLTLPSEYDLSYANAELRDGVSMPGERYQAVEYAEGVSDTEFADIESWTAMTGSYDTVGDTVTIDETISPGQTYAYHAQLVITDSEKGAIEDADAAAGQFAEDDGGLMGAVLSFPGMVFGGIAGFLGIRKYFGG